MKDRSRFSTIFVTAMTLAGTSLAIYALRPFRLEQPLFVFTLFAMMLVSFPVRISLPGIRGEIFASEVLILLALAELKLPEIMALGLVITALQARWCAK